MLLQISRERHSQPSVSSSESDIWCQHAFHHHWTIIVLPTHDNNISRHCKHTVKLMNSTPFSYQALEMKLWSPNEALQWQSSAQNLPTSAPFWIFTGKEYPGCSANLVMRSSVVYTTCVSCVTESLRWVDQVNFVLFFGYLIAIWPRLNFFYVKLTFSGFSPRGGRGGGGRGGGGRGL